MPYTHRVKPGSSVKLKDHDAGESGGMDKAAGQARFAELNAELDTLQEEMYAAGRNSVLMILQGMDTSGKDGAIRAVMANLNPQGCRVESFKVPTEHELAHDFLWRVHRVTPELGMFGVFNRSHYEDVLVVRVNDLVPKRIWERRYGHICAFEQMLADEGTTIVKFYLHIDKDEQKERLQARLDEPDKNWKFDAHDLEQRRHWTEYMHAFRDAIVETDRDHAPWYVVPANRKWYRDYAIMRILVDTLQALDLQFPKADFDPATIRID